MRFSFIFIFTQLIFGQYTRDEVREAFVKSIESKEITENWYKKLNEHNYKNDPIIDGYKACFNFSMAHHAIFYKKLSYFHKGKNNLNLIIAKNPTNIELRFLRYSAQKKTPKMLGYTENLKEDEAFLRKNLSIIEPPIFKKAVQDILEE